MKLSPSQLMALSAIDQGKVSRVPRGISQWKITAPASDYSLKRIEQLGYLYWRKEEGCMRAILTTTGRQALKENKAVEEIA